MRAETIRVIVADDEPLARRHLEKLAGRHGDIEVVACCRNAREAAQAAAERAADAILLDIEMPGMSGVELADKLRQKDIRIVFITAHAEYAPDAFDLEAVDYVLKPFDEDRLDRALDRLRDVLHGRVQPSPSASIERIAVETGRHVRFVDIDTIDWIEADDKHVLLHTAAETHTLRQSIGGLESRLDPRRFARIHRGTIVRLAAIADMWRGFHGDWIVTLRSGQTLLLSRRYRARLRHVLGG